MIYLPQNAYKAFYRKFPEEQWAQRALYLAHACWIVGFLALIYWSDIISQKLGDTVSERISTSLALLTGLGASSLAFTSLVEWLACMLKRPTNEAWDDLFEEAFLANFPISDHIVGFGPTLAERKQEKFKQWVRSKPFFKRNLKAKAMFIAESFQIEEG